MLRFSCGRAAGAAARIGSQTISRSSYKQSGAAVVNRDASRLDRRGSKSRLEYVLGEAHELNRLVGMCAPATVSMCTVESAKKKLAVFVSGGGSNFKCIHEACLRGDVHGEVALVVSNVATCGGVVYAKEHGIPVIIFPKAPGEGTCDFSEMDLEAEMRRREVDFVLLAGYLKLVPGSIVRAFRRKMLNIHPALLPAFGGKGFYGMRVHKAVLASGARISGPTVHFVDEKFDRGPILAQRTVSIHPLESPEAVASKVLSEEHKLYPACVAALCSNRITWTKAGVPIMWSAQ